MLLPANEKTYSEMLAESILDTFYVPNPKFGDTETVCKHNKSVDCSERGKCRTCGWNPYNRDLHNRRVELALRRREAWLAGEW